MGQDVLPASKVSVAVTALEYTYQFQVPSARIDGKTWGMVKEQIRDYIKYDLGLINPGIQNDGIKPPSSDPAIAPFVDIEFVVADEGLDALTLSQEICKASDYLCPSTTGGSLPSIDKIVTDVDYTTTIDTEDPESVKKASDSLADKQALENEVETATGVEVLDLT